MLTRSLHPAIAAKGACTKNGYYQYYDNTHDATDTPETRICELLCDTCPVKNLCAQYVENYETSLKDTTLLNARIKSLGYAAGTTWVTRARQRGTQCPNGKRK